MTIKSRFCRGLLSLLSASLALLSLFALLGVLLPGWLIELAYGPWDDLPIGTGLGVMLIALPVALLCLIALPLLTARIYRAWSPKGAAT